MRRLLHRRLLAPALIFFAIVGPGIITANVDNDAGGIWTYSQAGAQYGYLFLWTLIPITVALIVVQEMSARMGAVTGKGLADLMRENFGLRMTFYLMLGLLLADLGNTTAEFSGVAMSCEVFGVSKYLSVPIGAVLVWFLVIRGSYRRVEKVFLAACVFYAAYIVSGFLVPHLNWSQALRATATPTFRPSTSYIVMVVGVVGTTIAPWMQFYLQSAVVDKGVTAREYAYSRWDVIVGCIVTDVVAWFIIFTCGATIFVHHVQVQNAKQAALALGPLAGPHASQLFAFGLLNASLFSAAILPLATAYYVCEGLGLPHGLNLSWREAPQFYGLYTALVAAGAGVVLIPKAPLDGIMIWTQVVNGILLPFVLIYMLVLINKPRLMGEYRNSPTFNAIAWATVVIMNVLTLALVVTSCIHT